MHTINKLIAPLLVFWQLLPLVSGARATASQTVPPDAPQQNQTYTIPLKCDPLRLSYPILYLKINDAKPLAFVLDTGASCSMMITKSTQQKLHLKSAGFLNVGEVKMAWTAIDAAALCTSDPAAAIKIITEKGSPFEALIMPDVAGKQFQLMHIAGLVGLPLLQSCSPLSPGFRATGTDPELARRLEQDDAPSNGTTPDRQTEWSPLCWDGTQRVCACRTVD